MGIDGYLRRTDSATVELIRIQATEKNWTRLNEVVDEVLGEDEWVEHLLMNKEPAEDEEDEHDDNPDEQYFPTVFYDWVFPQEGDGVVPSAWAQNGDTDELFMNRASIFALVNLCPLASSGGVTVIDVNKAWVAAGERDSSMRCGIMGDYAPSALAEQARELGLLEKIAGEGEEAEGNLRPESKLVRSLQGQQLIDAVKLRGDTDFFWKEDWPPEAEGDAQERQPRTALPATPDQPLSLLSLPYPAIGRVLARLDCPSLCRKEILCKQSRSMLLLPRDPSAPPPTGAPTARREKLPATSLIDAQILTPLGLLAWFVCHRRQWGRLNCSRTLARVGYRADAIRRHLRRQKIELQLHSARGLRLGAEWHYIHFAMGAEAGKLLLNNVEANTGHEMGGSGIPILAHTSEEVRQLYLALRDVCKVDVACECDSTLYPGTAASFRNDVQCPLHPEWSGYSFWDYAEKARAAGVMGPRDLDDFDVGWHVGSQLLHFLRATVENKQGLIAYVW